MSKKANPTYVGVFVLGALALGLAAIIILGNFTFKDNRFRCVAYFTGSLYGLDVGASVAFQGVTIGQVSAVRISFDKQENKYIIPVFIDIEQTPSMTAQHADNWNASTIRDTLQQLIGQGLRAQLKTSSLLTGKLYIDLAFHPGAETQLHNKDAALFEIPTQATGLEKITKKLESLPLDEIFNKTAEALDGINTFITSKETGHTLESLQSALNHLNTLLAHADAKFPELAAELNKGLSNFATLSATANTLLQTADKELPILSTDFKQLMAGLNTTAGALTRTLNNIEQITEKDSLLAYQLAGTIQEIERAATSMRQLTDYLQQNPSSLLFGQGEDKP